MKREHNELVTTCVHYAKRKLNKSDWIHIIKGDMELPNIIMSETDISRMSTKKIQETSKNYVKTDTFRALKTLQASHKKIFLIKNGFWLQPYLQSERLKVRKLMPYSI